MKKLLIVLLFPIASVFASETTNETKITFQNFPWGTSQEEFIKKMGQPINREEQDGLISLIWENVFMYGYKTYMLAYFTKDGLQGGTYYFLTYDMDQLIRCYTEMQQELLSKYGPTSLYRVIQKEMRDYECLWKVSENYIHLKTNTRLGEPVRLLFLSPDLARQITGKS